MSEPQVRIYSAHGEELVPEQMTEGSVGIDVRTPEDIFLPRGCKTRVDSGLTIDVSEFIEAGQKIFTLAVPRSSAGCKHDVFLLNTVGVIDPDYCGLNPETGKVDEMKFFLGRRHVMPEVLERIEGTGPKSCFRDDPELQDRIKWIMTHNGYEEDAQRIVDYDPKTGALELIVLSTSLPNLHYGPYDLGVERGEPLYKKGDRFCQLLFLPYTPASLRVIQKHQLIEKTRGGFGSTGVS